MTTAEVIEFLLEHEYVTTANERYKFTDKFYKELEKDTRKKVSKLLTSTGRTLTDNELYKRFLTDAKIPRISYTKDGSSYITGAFTKSGAKALAEILRKGYKYEMLCAALNKYYQTTDYCTKVEQVLKEGIWETYYDMVKEEGLDNQTVKEKKTLRLDNFNKTIG